MIEKIRTRMLGNISDEYDKTEGGFFYDAVSPVAIELRESYISQDKILENTFVTTSSGEWLERRCFDFGITRKPARKSTGQVEITGAVGAKIIKGSLVSTEVVNFAITENRTISATKKEVVSVECQKPGTSGNLPSGSIKYFPLTLEGITEVNNLMPFSDGYDLETDEGLTQRYFEKINAPATSGNIYHYKQWAKEVEGVGDAIVLPTWKGPGTVKIIICDRNKRAATAQLVNDVTEYIEVNRPIGATVTVASAIEKIINITATITLGNDRTLPQVKSDMEDGLEEYFKNTALKENYISYAKIGSILYGINGVADYTLLKLNTGSTNITLEQEEIAVTGLVVFTL